MRWHLLIGHLDIVHERTSWHLVIGHQDSARWVGDWWLVYKSQLWHSKSVIGNCTSSFSHWWFGWTVLQPPDPSSDFVFETWHENVTLYNIWEVLVFGDVQRWHGIFLIRLMRRNSQKSLQIKQNDWNRSMVVTVEVMMSAWLEWRLCAATRQCTSRQQIDNYGWLSRLADEAINSGTVMNVLGSWTVNWHN